jgi:DNA ligase 1
MSIQKVYGIMNQIESQSAKTTKEQILKQHEGDTDFREALEFLLNPYIVTGISTKKMKKTVKVPKDLDFKPLFSMVEVMEYLKANNSGRDVDIYIIRDFIERQETPELQEFVRKFVTKDLKLGISEKTVNKVYGKGTIPSFAVMLAESYEKKADKVKGKFYITQKLDGNRCIAMKENGKVKFFTRKGQEIDGMFELAEAFASYPDNQVYDGELLLINTDNLPSDELFRKTQKVVRKDGEKTGLLFYMFDTLTVAEFKDGKSKKTYEQRRNTVDTFSDSELIRILPVLYAGDDVNMIAVLSKFAEEKGWEGLMVNLASGLYQCKRVVDLLKVKKMKTADLLCVSIEKAIDGQFEGILARINVEYKGSLVGVGSGFTIEERERFTANPDEIIGKIIEVQFFEESFDEKTKQPSLRFPVFKGIRHDKGIDDINYGE